MSLSDKSLGKTFREMARAESSSYSGGKPLASDFVQYVLFLEKELPKGKVCVVLFLRENRLRLQFFNLGDTKSSPLIGGMFLE